ncbi:MAG: type II toxin-antitoxin system prevent-host-death family antitoxin [Acidobacteriota bacterium]|nr:type II toxin-antitoxin system prevent-host-death family antitoxin [Acidobacteriota bacterium]
MYQVTIEEAKTHLPDLIESAISGDEVIISGERNAVKLVPVSRLKPRPQFGSAKGMIEIADNFDDPIEDFADYLK